MGSEASKLPPIQPVPNVDIQRFMGPWFVIGCIPPTSMEKTACNPVESYELKPDGVTVATTFSFNDKSPTGPRRVFHPMGVITDPVNKSTWQILIVWPIRTEYLIAYLDDDYQHTIIARSARDYAWIMSRSPIIADDVYKGLVQRVVDLGYPTTHLVKPHQDPPPRETKF